MGTATYRGTTPGGIALRIDLDDIPAIGETVRGRLTLEGESQPRVTGGSVAFIALLSLTSTSLDMGSVVAGALGSDDEDPVPTKTATTTKRVANVTATVAVAAGAGAEVGTFEFDIPLDAPASVRLQTLVIQWAMQVSLETEGGPALLTIKDVPVRLPAARIAQTPYLEPGALDAVVSGVKDDAEWSIEVDALPGVPGGVCRGTLLVTATERLRKARADVRIYGHNRPPGLSAGYVEWIKRGTVLEDLLEPSGRRRIVFELTIPPEAFVTTGAGDRRLAATLGISLMRWLVLGPELRRPIAIASPPDG